MSDVREKAADEMFCSSCGEIIKKEAEICPKCGVRQKEASVSVANNNNVIANVKQRHGFVTFWLIFGIVVSAIVFICICFSLLDEYNEDSIRYLIALLVGIASYILLLCWKKAGFYLILGSNSSGMVIIIFTGAGLEILGAAFSMAFSLAILYGVLRIIKNGKSTWEQLE